MTRRSDNGLRKAISVIEGLLLTDPSSETILARSTCQLMSLLGSSFSFAYQCKDASGQDIPWEFLSSYERLGEDLPRESQNSSGCSRIPLSQRERFLAGRIIISSDPGELENTLPHHHPIIENWCAVPITDVKRIHGIIYICNARAEVYDGLEARLRPFIAASGCLLRAADKKRSFQQMSESPQIGGGLEMLSGLLDTMFNSVIIADEDDIITMCNDAASSLLAMSKRDILNKNVSQFLPKGSPQIENRLTSNERTKTDVRQKPVWRGVSLDKADGTRILVDLTGFELQQGDHLLRGLVIEDISERMRSSADYHSTLQRFQALTNLVPVAILQLNRDWECTYANDTWCEYCQMTPDEAKGIGWLRGLHIADADAVLSSLRTDTGVTGRYEGEFRLQSPLGVTTWVKANASVFYNEKGDVDGLIASFNDITSHRSNEQRLKEIAEKDQLTGLVNRAFFNDRVEVALKGVRRNGPLALMFIDLDEFKHINDTLGHDAW